MIMKTVALQGAVRLPHDFSAITDSLIAPDPVDFPDDWVSRRQGDEHNLGAAVTQAP
jgi:hypothetical protein